MGSVYAALLRKAGHEVWAIDTWQEHVDAIARDGLRVSGASGTYVVDGFHIGALAGRRRTVRSLGRRDQGVRRRGVAASIAAAAAARRRGDAVPERPRRRRAGRPPRPRGPVVIGIAEGFGSSIPEPGRVHHNGMRLIRIGEMRGGADRPGASRSSGCGATPASTSRPSPTSTG